MSTKNRLPDYMDHLQQAAMDACSFMEGLSKDEAATKVMDGHAEFVAAHTEIPWRGMRC